MNNLGQNNKEVFASRAKPTENLPEVLMTRVLAHGPIGFLSTILIVSSNTGGNVVRGDQKLCKRSPYESVQI